MNPFAIVFLVANAIGLFCLPRRWAPLPLVIGACYMTLGQGLEIGPFTFTIIRILLATGLARVLIRRERVAGGMNSLDWMILIWAGWALLSSFFHKDSSAALIFRLGFVYNACGIYFLLRVFCKCFEDVVGLCRIIAILLIPLAFEMLLEKVTAYNLFSIFSGVPEHPAIREGRIRAQGPFAHSILAGTVGAVCLPLMIVIWQKWRKTSFLGTISCLLMIIASSSSGPIISGVSAITALFMWRYRTKMRLVTWIAIFSYISLDFIMKAPAYYLMGRVDLVGGSGGWHRARLIESAFQHLQEWWLAGTDYTRHWMPTGVSWSTEQTDITNYYIKMGVIGGLPLMLLFIIILIKGFSYIGETIKDAKDVQIRSKFILWAISASLFTHAMTFLSVSYFDQSFLFIYLTLAMIGSAAHMGVKDGTMNRYENGYSKACVK